MKTGEKFAGEIHISEALEIADSKEQIISITFITADEKRKTGGEVKTIKSVEQTGSYNREEVSSAQNEQPTGECVKADLGEEGKEKKKVDHFKNRTRNFRHYRENRVTKVHIDLMLYFNGKKIYW